MAQSRFHDTPQALLGPGFSPREPAVPHSFTVVSITHPTFRRHSEHCVIRPPAPAHPAWSAGPICGGGRGEASASSQADTRARAAHGFVQPGPGDELLAGVELGDVDGGRQRLASSEAPVDRAPVDRPGCSDRRDARAGSSGDNGPILAPLRWARAGEGEDPVSGRTEDFSGRGCDLGPEIFCAAPRGGASAPITSYLVMVVTSAVSSAVGLVVSV